MANKGNINNLRARAIHVKVDGTEEVIYPKDGKKFVLSELQALVGGYIETAPSKYDGWALVLDEEGRLKGKPVNAKATDLLAPAMRHGGSFVVGDAVYIRSRYLK